MERVLASKIFNSSLSQLGKFGSLYDIHCIYATKDISFMTSTDIRLTNEHDKGFKEIF